MNESKPVVNKTPTHKQSIVAVDVIKSSVGGGAERHREVIRFKNGAIYDGFLKGDLRDGRGVQVWPDGTRYEGMWQDDSAWGQGKFTHKNGDTYEGYWMHN